MNITLNTFRETLTVQSGLRESESVADIQRRLKQAGIPFRTIDGSSGIWEISSNDLLLLQDALIDLEQSWSEGCLERIQRIEQNNRETLEDVDIRPNHALEYADALGYKLFEEQRAAASYMVRPQVGQFALFWGMGTGKTGAMIAAASELLESGVIGGVLVVAERPISMEDPWQTSLESWLPLKSQEDGQIALSIGDRRTRIATYDSGPIWLVVHYGQLTPDLGWITQWADRRPGVERPLVIFDESDYIKNPKSNRSKSAKALREHFGRCWIASGTPAPNSPRDYQHQLSVSLGYPLDLGLIGEPEYDANRVTNALASDFYYLQQENPRKRPETVHDIIVSLNPTQREAYDQITCDLLLDLEQMDDDMFQKRRFEIMNRRTALLRVCSDPRHESLERYGVPGSPDFNEPAKFEVIDRVLEDILSDDKEKAVIWTRFTSVASRLYERYRERWGAEIFIGGEGDHRKLSEDGCRLLVATLQKGSSSISLVSARNAIYESLDDVSRDFSQSMARINRSGQDKDCRYWLLTSKDTVEEDVLSRTRQKIGTSQAVLDEIGLPGRSELIGQLRRTLTDRGAD